MPRCLDPFSTSLLESLAQGADPATLAATHSLSLTALARWLRDPHVKDTLDALRDLFALHHQIRQEQLTRDSLESLREVMTTSPDLAERRRSASAILRALSSPTRARRASDGPSPRATTPRNSDSPPPPRPSDADPSVPPASSPPSVPQSLCPSVPSSSDLPSAHLPFAVSPPPPHPPQPSDADAPASSITHSPNHPFTHSSSSPDSTADFAIARLRNTNPLDARSAIIALDPILDERVPASNAEARTILANLEKFAAALRGADIAAEPAVLTGPCEATKLYTCTYRPADPDAPPSPLPPRNPPRFTMRLTRADSGAWCLHSIAPLDTS